MAYQNNLIVRDILVVSDFFHLKKCYNDYLGAYTFAWLSNCFLRIKT